ncbi:MAG: hypothetical protein P8M71_02400 [Pseudomonadales bacterium]|nr:hypothetical protein [Pseudomonadales bacterium]
MKKLCIVLTALLSSNVNAEWGEQWGSMVWGQSSANVPMLGGVGQFIFFGLLLVIGLLVTNRWGLMKTLPAVAVLSLIPLIVEADEIQLNTFQNGEVADADEVNQNFISMQQAYENLKATIEVNDCYAHEGLLIEEKCLYPEIEVDGSELFSSAFQNKVIQTFDTSDFTYKDSNYIKLQGWSSPKPNWQPGQPPWYAECILYDPTGSNIGSMYFQNMSEDLELVNIIIEHRGDYILECSTNGIADMEIVLEFNDNMFLN